MHPQEELALEGIELHEEIQFPDNRPTLDLLLARPLGVLALLDEESHFPRASDHTFLGTCVLCRFSKISEKN